MLDRAHRQLVPRTPLVLWATAFVAIAVIGASLTLDLTGRSATDQVVLSRWSFAGLRVYLWGEALLFVAIVAWLGMHIASVGFSVAREGTIPLFGLGMTTHNRVPRQAGYVFVVLGAGLVALSLTTLVLFNSCRYMRLM
jgi:hypothetical protein